MTQGENSCTSPVWLPDGKAIAFLSSRGKVQIDEDDKEEESRAQVFLMFFDGGEAWQLTEHKGNIQSFRISPDGRMMLWWSMRNFRCLISGLLILLEIRARD